MRLSTCSRDVGNQRTPLGLGKLVRHELERLGGLWVKTAHIIAARRDVFPSAFCDELVQTREWAGGCPGDEAKRIVKYELGRSVDEMFREFDVVPIATTPIGQIHVAWLRNRDVKVAIKIQRPGVMETFASDLEIVQMLSKLLHLFHLLPRARLAEIRSNIENVVALELDYRVEAKAMRFMRRKLATDDVVVVPKIFSRLCSRRVFVVEFVDGVLLLDYHQAAANNPKNTKKWCRDNGIQPRKLLRRMFRGDLAPFLSGRLSLGLCPGDVMMLRKNRIALIDFGTVGLLGPESPCVGRGLMQEPSRLLPPASTEEHHAQIFEPSF